MYALWLTPDVDFEKKISEIMHGLAAEYNGPVFEPHITLLGKITSAKDGLEKATQELAGLIPCMSVENTGISATQQYFKSLFLDISQSETLHQAFILAAQRFEYEKSYDFTPHLSLLYGNQTAEEKQLIKARIGDNIQHNFKLECLKLVSAFGTVGEWEIVKSARLSA